MKIERKNINGRLFYNWPEKEIFIKYLDSPKNKGKNLVTISNELDVKYMSLLGYIHSIKHKHSIISKEEAMDVYRKYMLNQENKNFNSFCESFGYDKSKSFTIRKKLLRMGISTKRNVNLQKKKTFSVEVDENLANEFKLLCNNNKTKPNSQIKKYISNCVEKGVIK